MIGWIVQLDSGRILREREGYFWCDIDVRRVDKLWLEDHDDFVISRARYPRLLEFIQFKTGAVLLNGKVQFESQCIGWTDGVNEIIFRMRPGSEEVSMELHHRTHFHPCSIQGSAVSRPQSAMVSL